MPTRSNASASRITRQPFTHVAEDIAGERLHVVQEHLVEVVGTNIEGIGRTVKPALSMGIRKE